MLVEMVISKNIYIVVFTVLLSIFLVKFLNHSKPKHPDAGLNIEQLIQKYKYPIETHEVTTDDGYILTLHRIPQGQDKSKQNRIPILLMHGFSQSATNFVNLGPRKALSFLLADKGYDIWLGNARGTTWSRKHKSLDPNKDYGFWDYSMHEIGFYDVPAFIDHILKVTGQSKLHYVGYSQGASTFFMLLSEKPQYADKIKLMTALGPAIFLKDPHGPVLGLMVYFRKIIQFVLIDVFHISEFISNDGLIAAYLKQICDENSVFVNLCLHHNSLILGYNPEGTNKVGETHYITTEDGYTLTYHRIPHGIDNNSTIKRPAVFLMHGLTSSSADFVNRGPERSLAYILADAGHDVWLANACGNTFSRNHTTLDPVINAEKFYDFTWHEIGYYDIVGAIDYILNLNGDNSLYYIGHSQGTTAFLVLASSRPEYNAKIRIASLMAPAAILQHYPSIFI
ncbi:lipase 3-like [Asbolus verrucosus]|uniref:Lipase 3-like n=1 Tax=Asbolus verrucosus TaxID=1661398 RepID=A0A482W6H0_ASBVE|nr:lipase 3-like [Asbolus verrucosus]